MYVCCGSRENVISHTDPERSVSGSKTASFTNVPSLRNTCTRSLTRSQTYTKPSFDGSAQWTVLNCFDGGPPWTYALLAESSGFAPYAPQCRLYFPLSRSNTMTRRLPYPSAT